MVQTIFRDAAFVGNEAALIRVMGMSVMVIGWLYLFGGLSGGRRIVAASVLDRVVLVPLVLLPLAIAGVFPHFSARVCGSRARNWRLAASPSVHLGSHIGVVPALKSRAEYVVVELCARVIVLHAVEHILLGVSKTAGRQGFRWQSRKTRSIFIHRDHAANIVARARRGIRVEAECVISLFA